MSAILALLHRDGAPVDGALVERLLQANAGRGCDGQDLRCLGGAALAHQHLYSLPEDAAEGQPLLSEHGHRAVVFDGRLDNRRELLGALGLPPATISDARLVLEAHRAWGSACVDRLLGDYAFALWDGRTGEMMVARDPLGTRGLSYYLNDRLFVAASDIETILAHPDVPDDIDEVKIALYLASDWRDQQRTFFAAVRHLPPAHAMTVDRASTHTWRHWDLDPGVRRTAADHGELAVELRELLAVCTADRLRCRGPFGVSLSGGLDSSTVAALAAGALADRSEKTRLRSYSYVFDELVSCDERQWIEPTVLMHGLQPTYLPCDDRWTLRDPARWPTRRAFVDCDAFALLPATVRDAARQDGIRLLLTGYFADVLFLAGRYWLAEMLYGRRLQDAAVAIWRCRRHVRWTSDVWELGVRQVLPAAVKARYRRMHPRELAATVPAVSPALARRTALVERLRPDPALARWRRPGAAGRYLDLALGPRPQGLAISRPDYERLGIEVSDPFHDRRLVEFVAGLPAEHLGLPGSSKRLLRSATVGLLPEPVRTRPEKTDFGPLLHRGLRERERAWLEQLDERALVVEGGYVDGDWLRAEIARGAEWSEGGFPLWLCIALELWLRRPGLSDPGVRIDRGA